MIYSGRPIFFHTPYHLVTLPIAIHIVEWLEAVKVTVAGMEWHVAFQEPIHVDVDWNIAWQEGQWICVSRRFDACFSHCANQVLSGCQSDVLALVDDDQPFGQISLVAQLQQAHQLLHRRTLLDDDRRLIRKFHTGLSAVQFPAIWEGIGVDKCVPANQTDGASILHNGNRMQVWMPCKETQSVTDSGWPD